MRICKEENCDRRHQAKGYCQRHYQYYKDAGVLDLPKCSVKSCERGLVKKTYCKRHYDIQYKYGITPEQYEEMYLQQNGLCAICNLECATGLRLRVDHEHSSGNVRGLLCGNCNAGIGLLHEDIFILKNAIKYLT